MTDGPFAAVVDASVGIKLSVVESLSNEAHTLFAHLADDPPAQWFVPDLFYIECTNILWQYTRRLGLPPVAARLSVERRRRLDQRDTRIWPPHRGSAGGVTPGQRGRRRTGGRPGDAARCTARRRGR